jgi:hypothetical protein
MMPDPCEVARGLHYKFEDNGRVKLLSKKRVDRLYHVVSDDRAVHALADSENR